MGSGIKFFISLFLGFALALTGNSLLTSAYCDSDSVQFLCGISSIIFVPTATLILAIIFYLVIPNRD